MFCPISLRLSELIQTDPKMFLLESSRLEHNWLLCRLLVVFAGNLLTIIYGLLIIIWIYWCNWDMHFDESYQKILSNAYNAGVFIVVIGSYGCASIFIKSNLRQYFNETMDGKERMQREIRIMRYKGNDPQTLLNVLLVHIRDKYKLFKRCLYFSPFFTSNAVLITTLMPFEFRVVKKCINHFIDNYFKSGNCYTTAIVLILCLNVLFISLILIQFLVFIYICDLINTSLDKHQRRLKMSQELRERQSPDSGNLFLKRSIAQAQRHKNILFHQFINSHKTSPKEVMDQKVRTISTATTVEVHRGQSPDRESCDYVEPSPPSACSQLSSSPVNSQTYAIYL